MQPKKIQSWQKKQMVMHYENGLSIFAISKKVGLSHPCIDRFIENYLDKKYKAVTKKNTPAAKQRALFNAHFKPTKVAS